MLAGNKDGKARVKRSQSSLWANFMQFLEYVFITESIT